MAAYYNEIDPFAAAWLRNLIAAGLIPQGEVDERSVLEVEPADLRPFRQCHFFAGIAGWAHALDLAGWPEDRAVWTGSVPCQPLSSAGQRRGHLDERHLWPAFYRLIAECRPPTVFGEQVASRLGREWLCGVRVDLEHLGYAVGCADLPAACVGAPHIRQRLYWGGPVRKVGTVRTAGAGWSSERGASAGRLLHAERLADAEEVGRPRGPQGVRREARGDVAGSGGGLGDASEPRLPLPERQELPGAQRDAEGRAAAEPSRASGGVADTQRDDRGPDLAERRAQGRALDFWADAVWLQCLDGKARRVEPTIQPLATGLRNRVGMLRGSGNSIVPQAAAVFVSAVMEAL